MSLSEDDQDLLLFVLENLPQLLRNGAAMIARKAASTLPPPSGGRKPSFTAKERKDVLDYIWKLNRDGTPMRVAKVRASKKYACSLRTIARLTANRASVPTEDRPTIEEILNRILREGKADGWRLPTN
jgi:hypothetical protein